MSIDQELQEIRLMRMKCRARGVMSNSEARSSLVASNTAAVHENTAAVIDAADAITAMADELVESTNGLRWTLRIMIGIGLPLSFIIGMLAHKVIQ